MVNPRLIPFFTLINKELVKTTQFRKPIYVGDLMNNLKIAADFRVDEICVLDISNYHGIRSAPETYFLDSLGTIHAPIAFGGNIRTLDKARILLRNGIDKVVLGRRSIKPLLLRDISTEFGFQSVSVCIDIMNDKIIRCVEGKEVLLSEIDEREYLRMLVDNGVGEFIFHDVLREGTRQGLSPLKRVTGLANSLGRPVVWLGGASSIENALDVARKFELSGVGVGSSYIFSNGTYSVLPQYLNR